MPSFPCDECKETFSNTVLLKRHKLSGQCKGHIKALEEEKARRNRPLYNFDFFNDGKPAPLDVKLLRHPGVAGVHHSAGGLGSLGVYFINLAEDKGVLVFKEGTQETPADIFCSLLFRAAGVTCPEMKVLSKFDHAALLGALKDAPFTTQGGGDHLQNERAKRAGGVLMAFQPGFTLKDPRAKDCIAGEHGAAVLKSLGAVIAMDVLLNNFDRTPFVWSHEGNANNIMFARDSPTAFAIDNTSAAITDDEGREAYCSKVTTAVKEAINQTNGPHIKAVVTFLETWTGLTLTDEQRMAIQTGLVEACERISKQLDVTAAWQSMMQVFSEETSIGAANTDAINLSFIQQVQAAVTAGLEADL